MTTPLYKALAQAISAISRCNPEWSEKYRDHLESFERNHLPHGSGFDAGCKVDLDKSTPDKIYIDFSFHHMDLNGFYCGWTDHTVKITPSLQFDFEIKITRNRIDDSTLDYFHDTIHYALSEPVDPYPARD